VDTTTNSGKSFAESVLLYHFGFRASEKVLGPHHRLWTAFARHIDKMSQEDWERVAAAWTAARDASWDESWAAAEATGEGVVWPKSLAAAEDAAADAAEATVGAVVAGAAAEAVAEAMDEAVARNDTRNVAKVVAAAASRELLGWSKLEEPFFLRMFFDDPQGWVEVNTDM